MNGTQKIQELKSARRFGIMGIILEFAGVPVFLFFKELGFIISIIGLIFLFIAIKFISNHYKNQTPSRYILYSLISGIIMVVAAGSLLFLVHVPDVSSAADSNSISALSTSFITTLMLVLILFLVPGIVSISFQYLAYDNIGKLIEVSEFNTASLFLLTGTIITIISIVLYVSFIDVSNSSLLIGIIPIIILIGITLMSFGIIRLIIVFVKLPGEEKPVANDQNFNKRTQKELH